MEDNQNVETVETEEVSDATRAAIDAMWDDDSDSDWGGEAKAAVTDEPQEDETEPEAEPEGEDEGNSEGSEEEVEGEPETKPEEKDEARHQRFKLKVKGEEREVDLDEMTALAQKGGDYDGLKADRDTLRDENGKLKEYESFLKELADNGGISIDEVIESTRVEMLMRKAEADGKELSEDEARKQVKAAHKKAEPKEAPHEKTAEEQAQEAIQAFVKRYPNVKSEDIPQSVWDDANRTGDLVGAYQEYRLQKMSEEIATLKQNTKNKERSTGSRKTAGAASTKSKVDQMWDETLAEDF